MNVRSSAVGWFCDVLMTVLVCTVFTSCSGRGESRATLKLDAGETADAALDEFDVDGSGDLNGSELTSSPGLASAATMADRDGDGRLSREELIARFEAHAASGPVPYGFEVYYRGRPLAGATVDLIPATFYGDALPKAHCTANESGFCAPVSEGAQQGVWMGVYRVKVRSPDVEIPEKYNSNSELGLEVVEGGHLTRSGMPPRIELQ